MDCRNSSRSAVSFAISAFSFAESASMVFVSSDRSSSELSASLLMLTLIFTSLLSFSLTGALLLCLGISTLFSNFAQGLAKKLSHVSHRGHRALVRHARRAEHPERALHQVVVHVRCADERKIFARLRDLLHANQHVNRLRRFDARIQKSHEPMLLLNGRKQVPQLRLIGKLHRFDDLRRSFHMHLRAGLVGEHARIAQGKRVLRNSFVALALRRQFLQEIRSNCFQRPARIVSVQKVRSRIELRLREAPARLQNLVPRLPARGNQHHHHAPIRKQPHPRMLKNRFAQWWRNHNPQSIRNLCKHVSRPLRNFRRCFRPTHFPLNPLAIRDANRGLGSNLLRKKTVRRRRRYPPRRSMRLIKEAAIFQICHHVADRRRAQRLLESLGNRPRRNWFAGFNIRPNDVGQNLAVPPFLQRSDFHNAASLTEPRPLQIDSIDYIVSFAAQRSTSRSRGSTIRRVPVSPASIVKSVSSAVNAVRPGIAFKWQWPMCCRFGRAGVCRNSRCRRFSIR